MSETWMGTDDQFWFLFSCDGIVHGLFFFDSDEFIEEIWKWSIVFTEGE